MCRRVLPGCRSICRVFERDDIEGRNGFEESLQVQTTDRLDVNHVDDGRRTRVRLVRKLDRSGTIRFELELVDRAEVEHHPADPHAVEPREPDCFVTQVVTEGEDQIKG